MAADLTMELREWYLRAARQFGWSKTELTARIAEQAHLEIVLDMEQKVCNHGTNEAEMISGSIRNAVVYFDLHFEQCLLLLRQCRGRPKPDPVGVRKKCLRYGSREQGRPAEYLHVLGFSDIDCGCGYDMPIKSLACIRLEDMVESYI